MEIDILGVTYRVTEVEQVDKTNYLVDGEIDYDKQTISIKKNISNERKNEILWHEIIHGICEHLRIEEIQKNEHLVQCLGNAIYQVQKRNKTISF